MLSCQHNPPKASKFVISQLLVVPTSALQDSMNPGGEADCLGPHKGCRQGPAVLTQHLAHPVIGDGPVSLP